MHAVSLLKVHYFSYTEAQVWARIYTPPPFIPASSFLCTLTLTDCSRFTHVLKSLAQYYNRKQSLTSYYARSSCTEVRRRDSLINHSFICLFAKDNTRMTYENIYERNIKLLDRYIFTYNENLVTERCVFRPRK